MKYLIVFLTALVIFSTHLYIYKKGLIDGEWNYKNSRRIYFALKSAYGYGYNDCKEGRSNDWDNGGEKVSYTCSDCVVDILCWSGNKCY